MNEMIGKIIGVWKIFQFLLEDSKWICQCVKCGRIRVATIEDLYDESSSYCDCKNFAYLRPQIKRKMRTCYSNMHRRCKKDKNYIDYNIKVCERWSNKSGFKNFYEDMSQEFIQKCLVNGLVDTEIDRINGMDDYYLENCRWVSNREQCDNLLSQKLFLATRNDGSIKKKKNKKKFALEHGLNNCSIGKVLNGKLKQTGGYTFKFI